MRTIPFTIQTSKILFIRRTVYFFTLLMSLLLSSFAYAIAPVVDAYDDNDDAPASSSVTTNASNASSVPSNATSFSLEQRVTILERQISNLNPLLVQMDDLQQQLQQLQGKIETQQHLLKGLEDQLRNQYLAIEKRLAPHASNSATYSEKPVNYATANKIADPMTTSKTVIKTKPVSPIPNSAPSAAAERAYQAAFQLLKGKQYNEAIVSFDEFIKKYPSDLNVANANYFLGQLYLLQGQPEQSIDNFKRFTTRYSQDGRVPDAMLQLGLAYFAKGDKESAIDTFEKIIQQYPDSKAAQSAQARLQQFKAMLSVTNVSSKNKA